MNYFGVKKPAGIAPEFFDPGGCTSTAPAPEGVLTRQKVLDAIREIEALPPAPAMTVIPVSRTRRMPPLTDTILTTPAFDRAEFNQWMADFYGYDDHTILKPGVMIESRVPDLFGRIEHRVFIRSDDWERVQAAIAAKGHDRQSGVARHQQGETK